MLQIDLRGEEITLLPQKAVWWPVQKTLIVADLHWGKSAHFRKNGIAIPADTQRQDEKKLADMIRTHKAERLIIAGDLFHSKANNETESFNHWRNTHNELHIDLVSGNHDILPDETYLSCNIQLHKETLQVVPFLISHDAIEHKGSFIIHGHVHPAIRISGKGQQSVKLYCFAQDESSFVLPAFGQFTGTHLLNEIGYRHIYVVAENKIIKWK